MAERTEQPDGVLDELEHLEGRGPLEEALPGEGEAGEDIEDQGELEGKESEEAGDLREVDEDDVARSFGLGMAAERLLYLWAR